ncbi:NUDIX domain-containing protein [Chondrinema litorale]|uniref:NUDIX domain-containing protein n=1 Tax=Chondrinema litorale TaxID=2994555 RepID=UPI002542813B|nr:NUDIX hydrolase [Chondrinema litorale]UZR95592.1 NUDIX hydrolase [Chondrinema litorale]
MKKVNIFNRKWLLEDFLKVEEVQLEFEKVDGEMSNRVRLLSLERGDSVAALIWHTSLQKFIITKQFRLPAYNKGEGWILEIIAGGLKKGEDPAEAIKREVEEEIGYLPTEVEHINTFFVSPGGTSERILLYFGKIDEDAKVHNGGGLDDENEDIELMYFSADEFITAVENGTITDAKSIIAGLWLKSNLSKIS